MSLSPRISVVMPAFNAGELLQPAMESILRQSLADFEFIVIDDGSTDETAGRLAAWAAQDRRIRVLTNDRNLGLSRSLNRGLAEARAPWIARMDADDISKPERLARQLAVAERNPAAGLITCVVETIDSEDRVVGRPRRGICTQRDLLPWFMLFYNRIGGHGQVMYRRETVLKVGGYREDVGAGQDRELWLRLLKAGPCVVLNEPLYQWRGDNPGSVTRRRVTRYAEGSVQAGVDEIARACGVSLAYDEAVALRDFWLRFQGGTQDWSAVQHRLLELAGKFSPPRPVKNLRARLRVSIACGWLANALRAGRARDRQLVQAHLRRATEAAGVYLPIAFMRFSAELAAVRGQADRLI
jgi:glycosyltransferase involved in cell wall biosynthesis